MYAVLSEFDPKMWMARFYYNVPQRPVDRPEAGSGHQPNSQIRSDVDLSRGLNAFEDIPMRSEAILLQFRHVDPLSQIPRC